MISTRSKTLLSASALSLVAMKVVGPVAAELTVSQAVVAQAQPQGPCSIVEPSAFKLTDKNDMRTDKSYVASRLNAEDAVVIDGRNADAYVDGHSPGAKSLAADGLATEEAKVNLPISSPACWRRAVSISPRKSCPIAAGALRHRTTVSPCATWATRISRTMTHPGMSVAVIRLRANRWHWAIMPSPARLWPPKARAPAS